MFEDSYDDVIGFVHARDLLDPTRNGSVKVGELARPVKMLPTSKGAEMNRFDVMVYTIRQGSGGQLPSGTGPRRASWT